MKATYYAQLEVEHPEDWDKHDVATWLSWSDVSCEGPPENPVGVKDLTVYESFEDLRLDKEEEPVQGTVPLFARTLETVLRTTDDQEVKWCTSIVDGEPRDTAIRSPSVLQPTEWFTITGGSFRLEGDGNTWRSLESADILRILCRGVLLDPQFWKREEGE